MTFFRASFADFGETLRTVGLAIGLLVTSTTGVGYIYTLISDQKAMAVEVDSLDKRVGAIEAENPIRAVNRHRLNEVEQGVINLNTKQDKIFEFVQDFRAEVMKELK